MSIEQLSFDPSSIVVDGDILPAANVAPDLDPVHEESERTAHYDAIIDELEAEEVHRLLKLYGRVESELDKEDSYDGRSYDERLREVLTRFGYSEEEYEAGQDLSLHRKEAIAAHPSRGIDGKYVVALVHSLNNEGKSPEERARRDAISRARDERNPHIG